MQDKDKLFTVIEDLENKLQISNEENKLMGETINVLREDVKKLDYINSILSNDKAESNSRISRLAKENKQLKQNFERVIARGDQ